MFRRRNPPKREKVSEHATETVDAVHRSKMSLFKNSNDKKDYLYKTLRENKRTIRDMKSKGLELLTAEDWNMISQLRRENIGIMDEIDHENEKFNETDYISKCGVYLYEYYNVKDKNGCGGGVNGSGSGISGDFPSGQGKGELGSRPHSSSMTTKKKPKSSVQSRNIFDVLGKMPDNETTTAKVSEVVATSSLENTRNKKDIANDYYHLIGHVKHHDTNDTVNSIMDTRCDNCGGKWILNGQDSAVECESCCFHKSVMVEQGYSNFRHVETIPGDATATGLSYRRSSHFNCWLMSLQGLECSDISPELLENIRIECDKDGIDVSKLSNNRKIRDVLKRMRLTRHYEDVPYIMHKLSSGKYTPPKFGPELEHKLRSMFQQIQTPFIRHCQEVSPNRKNFISYSFTMYKFLQLLDRHDLLHHFTLLKSREKLYTQDLIWKKLCEDPDVNWKFIPSI